MVLVIMLGISKGSVHGVDLGIEIGLCGLNIDVGVSLLVDYL